MYRKLVVIFLLVALLAITTPVQAITYGELDGNQHPNVGGLVAPNPVFGWHLVVLLGNVDLADGFPYRGSLR